jgi:hypothetical protein
MPQWSLVGDAVMSLREMAADPPLALPAPASVTVTPSPTGSTSIWFSVTQLTPWGESPASTEIALTNGAIGSTFTVAGTCSFAATQINVYFTLAGAGLEDRYLAVTTQSGGQGTFSIPFTLSTVGIIPGFPPSRSSAWLPDTDGTALSAAALYRWINEGLDFLTGLTDGIRDLTGIPSTQGQAQYQLISNWRKLDSQFYDGWPLVAGNKSDIFRHNNVVGISGTGVMNQDSVIQQAEFYPQSSRTSGNGTLTSALTAAATSIPYTPGSSGWVLGFGLALLGPYPADPAACELVYYSGNSSNTLAPVTRGMGGTFATAWPAGTQVLECNLYLSGLRYPTHYTKGQSANQLGLPPAWIDALKDYLSSRFKGAEQDVEGQQAMLKQVEMKCANIKGNRSVMNPRRIQVGGTTGPEVCEGLGGFFGGVILPMLFIIMYLHPTIALSLISSLLGA